MRGEIQKGNLNVVFNILLIVSENGLKHSMINISRALNFSKKMKLSEAIMKEQYIFDIMFET